MGLTRASRHRPAAATETSALPRIDLEPSGQSADLNIRTTPAGRRDLAGAAIVPRPSPPVLTTPCPADTDVTERNQVHEGEKFSADSVTEEGDRSGRRRWPAGLVLQVTALLAVVVGACIVLVTATQGVPHTSRIGAGIALACLVAAGCRARTLLQSARGPQPGRGDTDPLTGLASRRALAQALAEPGAGTGSMLLVDLDNFRDVNEALGHETGDRLLTAVGARLRSSLRPGQMLARLGGNEFAVLLPGAGQDEAQRIANGLQTALHEPFDVCGSRLHMAASIGIATSPASLPQERSDLLRRADVALHHARRDRTGQSLYDPGDDDGGERLRRTAELRLALTRGDIEVHLQPQVDLGSGRIVGAEALARWRHPREGMLLPAVFLPLTEHTGLARPMAALVLDQALAACASWWREGHHVPVSVNLSADDLRDEELTGRVRSALQRQSLPPAALRVEITEQSLLTDPKAASVLLRRWRQDGISVSIDDFGTGYSSLSYLRQLPVDEVKLDQAFVADLARESTATIVQHTIAMAHGLKARVVAEGIEQGPTARQLADLGCDTGQGLLYGGAVTAPEFLERLRTVPVLSTDRASRP